MSMNASDEPCAPGSRPIRSSAGESNEASPVRVVLLASEPAVVEPVRVALNDSRIQLREVRDRAESAALQESWHPNLIIVDIDADAGQSLEQLTDRLPLLALTRAGNMQLSAFGRGADDVMVVPFASEELLARVLALGRRARQAPAFAAVVRSGELEIDLPLGRVRVGGVPIPLTATERSLLYLLVANAGRVLTRGEIRDALWAAEHAPESNVVNQYVRNLRAKFQAISRPGFSIATLPGRGYRFLVDDSVESHRSATSKGPRRQYCRDVDGVQEFDFGRVWELDERLAELDLVPQAA
jgi:DNA-binding response OmpR family regulator